MSYRRILGAGTFMRSNWQKFSPDYKTEPNLINFVTCEGYENRRRISCLGIDR